MLNIIWSIVDHVRSVIVSPSLVYKFGVDRIYSFGDIVSLKLWRFA